MNQQQQEAPRFQQTHCSQCGLSQGPGDSGYSHCSDHAEDLSKHFSARQVDELIEAARVSADLAYNEMKNSGALARAEERRAIEEEIKWGLQ